MPSLMKGETEGPAQCLANAMIMLKGALESINTGNFQNASVLRKTLRFWIKARSPEVRSVDCALQSNVVELFRTFQNRTLSQAASDL